MREAHVNERADAGTSVVGNPGANIAIDHSKVKVSGRNMMNTSGAQGTLDPSLVPEVMAKLQEIVRVLEAYGEEVKQHHPGEKGFLTRLTTISDGIKASVGLVAGVGPLLDEVLKLVH